MNDTTSQPLNLDGPVWDDNRGMLWTDLTAALLASGYTSVLEHTGGNVYVLYVEGPNFRVGVSDFGVSRETVDVVTGSGDTYQASFDADWYEVHPDATLAETVDLVRETFARYACPVCGADTSGYANNDPTAHHTSPTNPEIEFWTCGGVCADRVEATRDVDGHLDFDAVNAFRGGQLVASTALYFPTAPTVQPRNTITDRDVRDQVNETLPGISRFFDVDAIVREIVLRFGPVDVDKIDGAVYWEIVARFDRSATDAKRDSKP